MVWGAECSHDEGLRLRRFTEEIEIDAAYGFDCFMALGPTSRGPLGVKATFRPIAAAASICKLDLRSA
jgi:hypothetical protein